MIQYLLGQCFGVVYESRCVQCNGKEKGKDEKEQEDKKMGPSIYVEESSRNLRERAKEHHRDYAKKGEDSHEPHAQILGRSQTVKDHPSICTWLELRRCSHGARLGAVLLPGQQGCC